MQRFKIDARADLVAAEGRLASALKSLQNTANATTAAIAEATLPALERKCAELRAEIERLPDRPAFNFHGSGNFPCLTRVVPFSEAELNDFPEIPAFLRRSAPALAEERADVEW
jgi:hypothetical protein